jgi:hypothetical protein
MHGFELNYLNYFKNDGNIALKNFTTNHPKLTNTVFNNNKTFELNDQINQYKKNLF